MTGYSQTAVYCHFNYKVDQTINFKKLNSNQLIQALLQSNFVILVQFVYHNIQKFKHIHNSQIDMPHKKLKSLIKKHQNMSFNLFVFLGLLFLFLETHSQYSLCTSIQSSCLPCPIECKSCNSSFQCTACSSMYYLSGTSCLSCPNYCSSCNSTACIQCQNPFVLVNGSCQSCVVNNALSCSSTVSASSCQSSYYVNDNYCSSCLLNCASCTSSSTCTACNNNYYLNTSILTCSPCSSHCTSCNQYSPTTCLTCDNGYYINSSGYCSSYTCSLTNCAYCSSNNICGQCSQFYYWNGSQCVAGSSVLCQNGASGPLPTHCINSCTSNLFYASQAASPFLCIPYKSALDSFSNPVQQMYYYSYSKLSTLQSLSSSLNSLTLQSTGEYSFLTSFLMFSSISSFYRVQIKLKYMSSSSTTLKLSSLSQSNSTIQFESTNLNLATSPVSTSYKSYTVHSNNLNLTFTPSVQLIQIYILIYKCSSGCMQCLNLQLCQLCDSPNYMLGYSCVSNCTVYYHFAPNRTCLLTCPGGYYYVNNGTDQKYCQTCQSPCNQCTNSITCLSCISGYYYFNYTCNINCPNGYYGSNKICQTCISPCYTCTNKTTCLSCDQGYWNGTNCTTKCYNGTYGNNVTHSCDTCDNNCLTCSNSSTTCTSCISNLFLYNKKCLTACPDRYYSSGLSPLTCLSCKPPCETCTSSTACLTCSYNFYYNFECVSNCPNGYYQNLANSTCSSCSSQCLTCDSYSYCTSCSSDKCLHLGSCLSSCPNSQWYAVNTSGSCSCQECMYPCKQCTSQSACISCIQGYLYQNQCFSQCPTGYYSNNSNHQCSICSSIYTNCDECLSTKCTLCSINYLLYNGSCISSCPTYYYQQNQACNKCIAPCLQCTSYLNCTTCISPYILFDNSCIIQCPLGQFADISGVLTQCKTCSSPCLYCTSNSTYCSLCISGYYLFNNSCYQNCSTLSPVQSYYNEQVTSTCTKCMFPCKTCLSQYACLSCTIGYLNTAKNTCQSCTVGTYPNQTLSICENCPISCIICYSSDFCTACQSGYYLYQNICTDNLTLCESNGYYGIGRVCSLCNQPCSTCSKAATNCTTCLSGYIFFAPNKCLIQCPSGYYRNSSTFTCQLCDSACLTCTSTSTYCFSCNSGYYLYMAQMKCVTSCPSQTYLQNGVCQNCQYPCQNCTAQQSCTSCLTGTLSGDQCYSSCTNGYFSNSSLMCQQCQTPCQQCSTINTYCTQCVTGYYLYQNQCLVTCPSKTFAQKVSNQCISCLGLCYQCSDQVNCTNCKVGQYFYFNSNSRYGQCTTSCPSGYFSEINLTLNATDSSISPYQCAICRSDCLTCTNSSSCILCNNGQYVYNGNCYSSCPAQMYPYQGVCQSCTDPCYNCSDTFTCTACINSSYLLVANSQCIEGSTCPIGYYLSPTQLACNSDCPTGYYYLTNQTCNNMGCDVNQFMGADWHCYSSCPSGFIGNSTYHCVACSGDACYNGLFFQMNYQIKDDLLFAYLTFTQTPEYLISPPILTVTPNISYTLSDIISTSVSTANSQLVQSTTSQSGLKKITFTLQPSSSLEQTYFQVSFSKPLQTFSNPLQYPTAELHLLGYDKYEDGLTDTSLFGGLTFICAIVGLVKNPYMTDFGQIFFIIYLNNVHYPFNLRSFLSGSKYSVLNQFVSIPQQNMQGKGKFSYVVNNGLLQNCFANILLILIGFSIAGMLYSFMKISQNYCQYNKVSSQGIQSAGNEQVFIQQNQQNNSNGWNTQQQGNKQSSNQQTKLQRVQKSLQTLFSQSNFKIHYVNRIIYFNFLPLYLFSLTQLQSFDVSSGVNLMSSLLAILIFVMLTLYPFWFKDDKPKFTFLCLRKILVASSLILAVNYPIYCISVLSVTNITAVLLILSYKLQKWKLQMKFNALGQGLQFLLMVIFAIFIMIGQGNLTSYKVTLSWGIIILTILIMLYYIAFQVFEFTLWILKIYFDKDYKKEWIEDEKNSQTDSNDSQTLSNSMKDHAQKKIQPQQIKIVDNILEGILGPTQQNQQKNESQVQDSNKVMISPYKNKEQAQLFWTYDEQSSQGDKQKGKSPPKMLIRCVNDFSDFDQNQIGKKDKKH